MHGTTLCGGSSSYCWRKEGLAGNWQLMHVRNLATGSRFNKVSHVGRAVIISLRTSHLRAVFVYCICSEFLPPHACVKARVLVSKSQPSLPCLSVEVCECASTIKLHTLFEMAPKKDASAEGRRGSWCIDRFHFSIWPSKSEVAASQAVYMQREVGYKGPCRKQILFLFLTLNPFPK